MPTKKHPKTITVTKRTKARIKAGEKLIPVSGGTGSVTAPYTLSKLRKNLFTAVAAVVKGTPIYAQSRKGEAEVVLVTKSVMTHLLDNQKPKRA